MDTERNDDADDAGEPDRDGQAEGLREPGSDANMDPDVLARVQEGSPAPLGEDESRD